MNNLEDVDFSSSDLSNITSFNEFINQEKINIKFDEDVYYIKNYTLYINGKQLSNYYAIENEEDDYVELYYG